MLSTLTAVAASLLVTIARAASLQTVNNFGAVYDTKLVMQIYVPANLPSKPPVLLALHPCGGSGSGFFSQTRYSSLADAHGVVLIFPSSPKDSNCWDVASSKTLTHNGHGDTEVLINMVDYVIKQYNADSSRVFVTGTSSGCMMTNAISATYPDRFNAASCYSGVAAGCMAGQKGSSPISTDGQCANGHVQKTGSEWAAQVRAMYPGYSGKYPRFLTWHGTADFFVTYQNFLEQIKEWSTLQGVTFSRNETNTPQSKYTRMVYGDGTKFVAISAEGVGHTVPSHEEYDFQWFGIM